MRKALWQRGLLLLAAAAALVGCKDDDADKLKVPTVAITENGTFGETVEFTITAKGADECAFIFDTEEKIGGGNFDAATILAEGEKVDLSIEDPVVKDIVPGTQYVVFAAAKNAAGLSEVARCDLNVPNLVNVEVSDITKSSFTFTVTTDGDRAYKYVTMPAQYLEEVYKVQEAETEAEKNTAAMRYLAWYGFKDNGTKSFTHNDNETYTDVDESQYTREIIAGMEYAVLAVGYGRDEKFSGKVAIAKFKTAESGAANGNVQFEAEVGIISAKITCTPDDNVLYYKALLMKKANKESYIQQNGEEQYRYQVANNDNSRHITGIDEYQWKNLSANTEYVLSLLIIDKDHNTKWVDNEFKTKEADEQSADIQLSGHTGDTDGIYYDPWNALTFNVKSSEIVLPSKYFFGYTSLVTYLMNQGLTLEEVINQYGESFSQWNLNTINGANGYNAEFVELKPDVAYTYAVAMTNANGKVGIKSMELRTEKRVVSPLSQSSLFDDLAGVWATVVPIKEWDPAASAYKEYEYRFDVTIGNDNEFGELCRSYNWLMCTGWAGLEYKSPDDLRNDPQYDGFYKEVPENIFYNFGPKWFLEIDAEGNVTVPTNSSFVPLLMNYDEDGPGARLASVSTYIGSDALPVEVSADKNTITIKPYQGYSGLAYLMLVDADSYSAPSAKTSGDIVMTRKQ